jgi:hypothetical protein
VTTRTARSRGVPRRTQPAARRSPWPFVAVGALVVAVLAVAALLLTNQTPSDISEPAAAPVEVSGAPLAPMSDGGADRAIGRPLPTLRSVDLDGESIEIGPGRGALAVVVVAHWCPHCQNEIPVLADWLAANELPSGVEVVTVSTGIDPARPNYPPSAWLAREGWSQPTLVTADAGRRRQLVGAGRAGTQFVPRIRVCQFGRHGRHASDRRDRN